MDTFRPRFVKWQVASLYSLIAFPGIDRQTVNLEVFATVLLKLRMPYSEDSALLVVPAMRAAERFHSCVR